MDSASLFSDSTFTNEPGVTTIHQMAINASCAAKTNVHGYLLVLDVCDCKFALHCLVIVSKVGSVNKIIVKV